MLQFFFWVMFLCWLMASGVLILVVLVQSGKGGGLSGLIGAGSTLGDHLGATGAEKTLNRWTTYCAVAFITLTVILVFSAPKAFRDSPFYRAKAIEIPTDASTGEQTALPDTFEVAPGAPEGAGLAPVESPAVETTFPAGFAPTAPESPVNPDEQ